MLSGIPSLKVNVYLNVNWDSLKKMDNACDAHLSVEDAKVQLIIAPYVTKTNSCIAQRAQINAPMVSLVI